MASELGDENDKKGISGKMLTCEAGSEHSLSLAEMRTNNIHSKATRMWWVGIYST